jgi:exopolysaccharide biosynthesis polyprenyl glycosylphosphotransferase
MDGRRLDGRGADAIMMSGADRVISEEVSSLLLIAGFLLGCRAVIYGVRYLGPVGQRVVVLGTSALAAKVIEEIEARPELGLSVAGVVDAGGPAAAVASGYPVLGPLEHLDRVIEAIRPERIIVALAERRGRLPVRRLLELRARGIVVEDGAEAYERLTGKLALESLSPSSVIFSPDFQVSRLHLALGRSLGLLASLAALIVLAPLLGLIALAIKLDSAGPVFFIQERVGLHGRPFKLIKFRTMHPAGRATSEWARDNSDRITRLGKWLRRYRLDEVPQLVNVLRGDMNLVGPRPHPVTNLVLFVLALRNLNELSGDAIPYYALRCAVRPGITGWAQVRYGYANTLEEEVEKIRYDLYYLKHLSVRFDLRILFETIKTVLTGRGATGAAARRGTGQFAARAGRAA